MKNNQLIWAKTLLNAYKYLGSLCDAIDKLVESTAKNSFFTSGIWSEENSITNVSKKIIYLTNKKVDYINLKIIAEKIIASLSKNSSKLIVLKYLKGLDSEVIARVCNMSERSYFRKSQEALEDFAERMQKLGYNSEKMYVNYFKDSFIQSVFSGIELLEQNTALQTECAIADIAYTRCVKNYNFGLVS